MKLLPGTFKGKKMRRRKLYRYSQGNSWNPRPRVSEYDQKALSDPFERRPAVSEFDLGVKYGISIVREQQAREYAEVRREALVAAKGSPYFALARRGGFEEGFAAGMKAAQNPGQKGTQFTYADVESARRRGYEEGRSTVSAQRNTTLSADESSIRKRAIEDMLESCRVIAESNPNMNSDSFLKAVRQRSKKIA